MTQRWVPHDETRDCRRQMVHVGPGAWCVFCLADEALKLLNEHRDGLARQLEDAARFGAGLGSAEGARHGHTVYLDPCCQFPSATVKRDDAGKFFLRIDGPEIGGWLDEKAKPFDSQPRFIIVNQERCAMRFGDFAVALRAAVAYIDGLRKRGVCPSAPAVQVYPVTKHGRELFAVGAFDAEHGPGWLSTSYNPAADVEHYPMTALKQGADLFDSRAEAQAVADKMIAFKARRPRAVVFVRENGYAVAWEKHGKRKWLTPEFTFSRETPHFPLTDDPRGARVWTEKADADAAASLMLSYSGEPGEPVNAAWLEPIAVEPYDGGWSIRFNFGAGASWLASPYTPEDAERGRYWTGGPAARLVFYQEDGARKAFELLRPHVEREAAARPPQTTPGESGADAPGTTA